MPLVNPPPPRKRPGYLREGVLVVLGAALVAVITIVLLTRGLVG